MFLGIDPGWVNVGVAVLRGRELIASAHICPKEMGVTEAVKEISAIKVMYDPRTDSDRFAEHVSIERYVAYKGVVNAASEQILMIIGALQYVYEDFGIPVKLYRAIEWKPGLCKHLVRTYGFSNPSSSFDKKFSIAAAECIIQKKVESDHIADAICLAYYGSIDSVKKEK